MERILDLLAIFSLVLLFVVLWSLRRSHIRVEHSVSWIFAALVLLLVSRMPTALHRVAGFLGLGDIGLTLVVIILLVFLGVFYRFSRIVSELKDMNIALTQKVAILEHHLRYPDHEESKTQPAA